MQTISTFMMAGIAFIRAFTTIWRIEIETKKSLDMLNTLKEIMPFEILDLGFKIIPKFGRRHIHQDYFY